MTFHKIMLDYYPTHKAGMKDSYNVVFDDDENNWALCLAVSVSALDF